MEYDVVITVFACSTEAPCSVWANDFFKEPPLVISIPGAGSSAFRTECQQLAKTGDIFDAAVKKFKPLMKDVKVRRRILVTFSAGWNFADELFRYEAELNKLDCFVLLDGCHTKLLSNWQKYADRAAAGKCIFIMAHTEIIPTFVSTTVTNSNLFTQSLLIKNETSLTVPEYILNAELPAEGVMIRLAAIKDSKTGKITSPAVNTLFKKDTLKEAFTHGKIVRLAYSGNDRPDHVYIAWFVSKRIWKWLGELFLAKEEPVSNTTDIYESDNKIYQEEAKVVKLKDVSKEQSNKIEKITPDTNIIINIIMFLINIFKKIFKQT